MIDYLKRNHRWIAPLMSAAFIVGGTMIIESTPASIGVPQWLIAAVAVLACIASGLGAARTETTSARLLWFVGSAAVVAGLVHNLLRP